MDLDKIIRDLYEEKKLLDETIERLEMMLHAGSGSRVVPPRRRGRKGMTENERREVSQRMKEYWAQRRKEEQRKDDPE